MVPFLSNNHYLIFCWQNKLRIHPSLKCQRCLSVFPLPRFFTGVLMGVSALESAKVSCEDEKTTTTWFWVDILKKSHYFQPCFFFNLNLGEKVFRAVIWICNFFQMKIIWKWRNLEIQVLTNWCRGPCQAWSLVRWYLYLLLSSSVFWEGTPQSFKYASVHFKGPGYHKTPSNSFPRWWLSETGIFCDEIWITVTLCEDTKKGD